MESPHQTASLIFGVHLVLAIAMGMSEAQCSNETTTEKEDLYIVAMLPYPVQNGTYPVWQATREDGPDIAPAVYLAVEQINNRTDILNNYTLHVIESDGACDIRTRTYISILQALYDILERKQSRLVGFVGPACSDSAEVIASLTSTFHLPAVALHLGADPILTKYPHLFGIGGSIRLYAETLVQLVVYSNWHKVGILFSDIDNDYHLVYQQVYNMLRDTNVDVPLVLPVSETYVPLQAIEDAEVRVIIAIIKLKLLKQVMCLAYHAGLLFPANQWVFVDRAPEHFTEVNFRSNHRDWHCSDELMHDAIEGSLAVVLNLRVGDNTSVVSGQMYSQYIQDYTQSIKRYRKTHMVNSTRTVWANPLYDATWALALALNKSIVVGNPYSVTQSVTEKLYEMNFMGVSGRVSFDSETGFSTRNTEIFQFSNDSSCAFGRYSLSTGFVANLIPVTISSEFEVDEVTVVPLAVSICTLILLSIPLLPAVLAHVTSCIYHRFRPIKASSYRLNQLAYTGFYVFFVGIPIYAVYGVFSLSNRTHDVLCLATMWTNNIGPSLVLGTICVKCVRLYKLYTSAQDLKPITNKYLLWDSTLAFGVAALMLPEVALLTVRTILDPPQWRELTRKTSGSSPVIRVSFGCISVENSDSLWFLIEIGYKSLLALFAFWLAHNSRKLQEKGFHVKNVITLVYILTFATLCVIPPVLYVFTRSTTPNFAAAVFYIGASYFAILLYSCTALLFLPPVIVLLRGKWKGEFGGKSFWSTTPSAVRVKPKSQSSTSYCELSVLHS